MISLTEFVAAQYNVCMHREIPVKVNALVDKGIAPLVEVLSRMDRVLTLDSCQGGRDSQSYVYFGYRGPQKRELEFFYRLAKAIAQQPHREPFFTLKLEWRSGNERPLAKLQCSPEVVPRLAKILRSVVSNDRMIQ